MIASPGFAKRFAHLMKHILVFAIFATLLAGCDTTVGTSPSKLPSIKIAQTAKRILVIDRHQFGYQLWYSSSRDDESPCGYQMTRRPIRLKLAGFLNSQPQDLGVQFASVFNSHLPEELLDIEMVYHGSPLTRGIIRDLPMAEPEILDAAAVHQLAHNANSELVLSVEWVSLQESLVEETSGSEAVRGGTSVTYELRSIKTSKVQARLGFRLYDGKSGLPIERVEYANVRKNKYREPIDCEQLLAGESYKAIANCFQQLVSNLQRADAQVPQLAPTRAP